MKIAAWYNLTQKAYEAAVITKGRPIRQDAPASEREKSTRKFFTGTTKEAALQALANTHGMKLDEVVAAVVKDTKMIYKGKREHPSGWSRKKAVEVIEA
jgi:hypothetical protein